MTDATEPKTTAARHGICRLAIMPIAIAALAASFAAGYRVGVARQEQRLLRQFVINAARLGVLDCDRLKELTDDADTNFEPDRAAAHDETADDRDAVSSIRPAASRRH